MKDINLKDSIYKMCIFTNPNDFNNYHKSTFKNKNDKVKNYFYVSTKNEKNPYRIHEGQFLKDKLENYNEQKQNKIINKGKKKINTIQLSNKRDRNYIILTDDKENEKLEEKDNYDNLKNIEISQLGFCPLCLSNISNFTKNKRLNHLLDCKKLFN